MFDWVKQYFTELWNTFKQTVRGWYQSVLDWIWGICVWIWDCFFGEEGFLWWIFDFVLDWGTWFFENVLPDFEWLFLDYGPTISAVMDIVYCLDNFLPLTEFYDLLCYFLYFLVVFLACKIIWKFIRG